MSDSLTKIRTTFQVDSLAVRVYNSVTDLTQDAANLAENYLESLLKMQDTVTIVLATGNSQLQFLDYLVNSQKIDWSRIVLFHLDEYLGISATHAGSFRYYLQTIVASKISPRQFYYIKGDNLDFSAECDRYSSLLKQYGIDLCMLGIGDNGHLAFNEPSVADFNDCQVIKLVKLETMTRQQQVNGGYFPNLETVPQYAYTLTIPTICSSQKIFCLAGGKNKKQVVEKTLQSPISSSYPATILRRQQQAILFCTD